MDNEIIKTRIDILEKAIRIDPENLSLKHEMDELIKGGKKGGVGEIREWNGKKYQKRMDGKWRPIKKETQLPKPEQKKGEEEPNVKPKISSSDTNKLLNLIERIYGEKVDSFKLEGNQLYVQLETGKGYSSDGWSMSGIWDNKKLIIGSHIWTKDSYTNSKSKVTIKRSAYRNKPKEFGLVDALRITKVGPITINIAQELD